MALDTSSQQAAWHPLLTIADVTVGGTPAQTVRWSDADLSMSDGTLYTNRIKSVSPLRQELGRLLETQFVLSDLKIELDNADDAVRDILTNNANLAGKATTLDMGQGQDVTVYERRFTGEIRQPDGVYWDDKIATLTFDDALEADAVTLPVNSIWPSTYPNAEAKSKYHAIPEVLGDFRTTAGGGETVPGFCVDTTVGTGGQFTFGQHLEALEAVYLNGVATSYTTNQLTGPSLVTLDVAYAPLTDAVSANVNGRATTNAGAYPAAENVPTAWAYDILTASWGMNLSSSTRVDTTTFNATYAASYYGAGDKCRRWVGSDIQAVTLLAELGLDGFFELFIEKGGKWKPVFRLASSALATTVIRKADLIPTADGGRVFAVQSDAERTYANQIVYDYRYRPPEWDGETLSAVTDYAASGQVDDAAEKTTVGRTVRRRIKLRWLYETTGADDRGYRDLYVFGKRLELPMIDVGPAGLGLERADTFQLLYSKYALSGTAGTPCMVRSIDPDYRRMRVRVTAWNIDRLSPRRYQADGSAAWAAATTYDKSVMGYHGAFSGDDEQLYM